MTTWTIGLLVKRLLTQYQQSSTVIPVMEGSAMTKKAIGYIRVSTEGQAVDGVSLDAQKAKITTWAVANDYQLADVYVDAGLSGKRADNRPGLQDALRAACAARGTALVVYSLSRLARSVRDTLDVAERLDRAGADLVSLSEKLDTTNAAGKMVFRMLAVLGEFERDLTSERTKGALAHKKFNREVYGEIPYGFRRDGDALVADAGTDAALLTIKAMRTAGHSYQTIADTLTKQGIPTAKGKTWASATVRNIALRMVAA